jgi:sulfonate transport system permease protein
MRSPRFNGSGAAVLLALACLWEGLIRFGGIDFEFLPAPSKILVAWWLILVSGELFTNTAHTLSAVGIGWIVAVAIGVGLGIMLGLSSSARKWSLASLEVLRPLPAIAFLPLALLLFNFSLKTELVLIIYASAWPAFVNTLESVKGVSPQLRDVGKTLRLSRTQTLFKILLPAMAPSIAVGCRLSMGLTLIMAIIAEMLANPHGLGYAVISELQAMQPQRMFAYILYIGLLAILLNSLIAKGTKVLLRNHPNVETHRG